MHYEKLTENRQRFVNQLIPMIESTFGTQLDENKKIKTIAINAPWGMGKSLLKEALYEKLIEKDMNVITINAWETDYFNDPMKSLVGEISCSELNVPVDTVEKGEKLLKNMGSLAAKIASSVLLKKLNFSDEDISNIKSLLKGLDTSGVEDYKKYKDLVQRFKKSFEIGVETPKRVIIIDELDRCKPNYAIEMLEAIKHIFEIYNLTFVFLINKTQLKETVKNLYGCELKNEDYFEKFFDVQLKLPEIDIRDFIKIEYQNCKYDKSNFVSEDLLNFEKFMMCLFFKVLEKKYFDIEIKSVRQLRKSLNKFTYLVKTFTEQEKNSLVLITGFIVYFMYGEFYEKTKLNKSIYGFDISGFFDELFINPQLRGGNYIASIDSWYNPKCVISHYTIEKFYRMQTAGNVELYSLQEELEEGQYTLSNINVNYNDSFRSSEGGILRLPLSESFIAEYGAESIYQWCKEKYEFTLYME